MDKVSKLFKLANDLATKTNGFYSIKGPGKGNHSTNAYISELGIKAKSVFGADYSEQNICGNNSLAVDFYFPDEETVVEIALGLKNPNTEYEKDILKAIMAKSLGNEINKLVFICKPGGAKKCNQPGRVATKEWLKNTHGINISIMDLG